MQSVRGVGYDARSAIADLVDNSIAAGAQSVWIRFLWEGAASSVAILDDGHGMASEQLDLAMMLGSRSPLAHRKTSDLGRFGLGLKTASLSQCSRLIVASRRDGLPVAVRVWDLCVVQDTNDWLVEDEVDASELGLLSELETMESGTLVLWRHLDRLVGKAQENDEKARLDFQRTSRDVESHLAMTFHRYLEGSRPRLRIFMNGAADEFRIRPWDPFCSSHPATQQLPEVRRGTRSGTVVMQGFVLPHKDRLDTAEHERAGGPGGWVGQEGFYVYRNERLLVPGSWLGLGQPRKWTKDEQHKLARVRLDLPNSADADWAIDIKKSRAQPPLELKDWLSRNAERVRQEAKEVFIHRGTRVPAASQAEFSPIWLSDSWGALRYRINREHPLVAAMLAQQSGQRSAIESVLRMLESTIPVHRIWLDVADRPEIPPPVRTQLQEEDVRKLALDLLNRLMNGQNLSRSAALHRIRHTEPFDQFADLLNALDS